MSLPHPQNKLNACQASSWNTLKEPKSAAPRDVETCLKPPAKPGGNTYLLWGNRAQHRGVANTRLREKSVGKVCEALI